MDPAKNGRLLRDAALGWGTKSGNTVHYRTLWACPILLMKSILSVVPAPKENPQSGKDLGRALPIEFVELSRTESYGY
jgi:hypothetical protein